MTKAGIRKADKRKIRWKNELEGFLFVLPWIIGFFLFSLYPIFMSGYYRITDFSAIKDPKWVGIDNFPRTGHVETVALLSKIDVDKHINVEI